MLPYLAPLLKMLLVDASFHHQQPKLGDSETTLVFDFCPTTLIIHLDMKDLGTI
jgi:hypothetical protein